MPTVERTQISLGSTQAARLRRLARERGTSMAALIRDAVDHAYPESEDDSPDARWARALGVIGKHHSGLTDVSIRHDDYIVDAIEEHLGLPPMKP